MRSYDDPAALTPDERLAEVAKFLAVGMLRLHATGAISTTPKHAAVPGNLPETAATGLEVSAETVLSVHCG